MIVTMAAGALFPTVFYDNNGEVYDHQIKTGGMGSLGFNYFLSPGFYIGGEINAGFSGTVNNLLITFPFGFRGGYQFIFGRFEFPLSLTIGMVSQRYLSKEYFGFFMKPEVSAYWRFNPDWSFGFNVGWWWVPQWPKAGAEYNRDGNFLPLTLSARYLF
jgi:hypothetical protein